MVLAMDGSGQYLDRVWSLACGLYRFGVQLALAGGGLVCNVPSVVCIFKQALPKSGRHHRRKGAAGQLEDVAKFCRQILSLSGAIVMPPL